MYLEPEVHIKLSAIEIQQALSIDLDRGSSQALQFIKEKIVAKYFRAACKLSSVFIKGATPMKIRAMQQFLLPTRLSLHEVKDKKLHSCPLLE